MGSQSIDRLLWYTRHVSCYIISRAEVAVQPRSPSSFDRPAGIATTEMRIGRICTVYLWPVYGMPQRALGSLAHIANISSEKKTIRGAFLGLGFEYIRARGQSHLECMWGGGGGGGLLCSIVSIFDLMNAYWLLM